LSLDEDFIKPLVGGFERAKLVKGFGFEFAFENFD
jgi:hypothetical protein